MSRGGEISVYDRMCWPQHELERALARGEHRRELAAYLGEDEYGTLTALARRAEQAARSTRQRRRAAPTVYLLPGILGSQLGRPRAGGAPPDLLWLDPADIVEGRLTELHWPDGGALQPLGAIVYSYLALKLRLVAAGFAVVLYAYDWRRDLTVLGRELAARLDAHASQELMLVGHSMGGLLARAALRECEVARVTRVVGLGTPHGGSIAAVQALRATYPVVCRLAALDRSHTAEYLTSVAFRSFASLYQLLPAQGLDLDLFDPGSWPPQGPQPDAALLAAARGVGARLAVADGRFVSIIGTGQRTASALKRHGEEFHYQISAAGDGTVPAARATLAGARNYYLRCEHSELPRSERVAAALIDVLRTGSTRRLSTRSLARPGRRVYVGDSALRRALSPKIDWYRLSIGERRRYLNRLSAAPEPYGPARRRGRAQ